MAERPEREWDTSLELVTREIEEAEAEMMEERERKRIKIDVEPTPQSQSPVPTDESDFSVRRAIGVLYVPSH